MLLIMFWLISHQHDFWHYDSEFRRSKKTVQNCSERWSSPQKGPYKTPNKTIESLVVKSVCLDPRLNEAQVVHLKEVRTSFKLLYKRPRKGDYKPKRGEKSENFFIAVHRLHSKNRQAQLKSITDFWSNISFQSVDRLIKSTPSLSFYQNLSLN